ncbi:wax ester/triacylglycerol synthase family O-acyltransferase [Janibacter sp. GXQ6167]|uniref:WS/DGAT/MGAT family O-acyltransferase n=1 Tax=Janibacter sp. GXQ6167 TaxID=3240791 RepID=UPI0035252388
MARSSFLSPLDAAFVYGETRSMMFHVGALLVFEPPKGAGPTFVADLYEDMRASADLPAPWNRRLRYSALPYSPVHQWVTTEVDLDYHLRRSALPSPGGERELGILVSRLHGHPLDFSRPPWEWHLIEGLDHGRFALYTKMHHALADGYTGMQMLQHALSTDAEDRTNPFFFGPGRRQGREKGDAAEVLHMATSPVAPVVHAATGAAKFLSHGALSGVSASAAWLRTQVPGLRSDREVVTSHEAPRAIINRRIGRNRRFATQALDLETLKEVGHAHGATVNDVLLSVIGGGLRRYLSDLDELPEDPLIAFVPVNIRADGDAGGGNAVGAVLTSTGSDEEDPIERLHEVTRSTRAAKGRLAGMGRDAIMAYSGMVLAPMGLQAVGALAGIGGPLPLALNLCVSNVPGPQHPLYLRGAELVVSYPASIPAHGMGLNITVHSYNGTLGVGFIACRDTVPHLQRLAVAVGDSLEELVAATAAQGGSIADAR